MEDTTSRTRLFASRGAVNLGDLRFSVSRTRSTFTRWRNPPSRIDEQDGTELDFITLISLICSAYRDYQLDLIPIQQFHPDAERYEDSGHTVLVSHRAIWTTISSNVVRGETADLAEDIVVKRPKDSVLTPGSKGLKSLITELRIRTHPPIRKHPNIAVFKGIAWDFEDDKASRPRPLLLEELAWQKSMVAFWRDYKYVRMTFQSKIELCLDVADGLAALHACGIVHGDVKPDNILIFPRIGYQNAFMAKLTDFGHSVSACDSPSGLPAFTPQWAAPEVLGDCEVSFDGLISTDVYSYGLVALSIILGRSYFESMPGFMQQREKGTLLEEAMALIENEDRENHDSDFELDIIHSLLSDSVLFDPAQRSLPKCYQTLQR